MKKALLSTLLLIISNPANAKLTGIALAQKIYDRPDGKDSVSSGSMVLIDKNNNKRERKLSFFRREASNGTVQSLIRFHSPKTIEDTGMLTVDEKGKDSQQHLFLPATKKARRISSSRKGGRFVQSDFYFQDMQDRLPSKDKHKIIGTSKQGKHKCTLLESTPVTQSSSVYKKVIRCIHLKSLLDLRIDYFEKSLKKPSKRLVVNSFKKVDGIWTAMKSEMTDLKSKHRSIILLDKIRYNIGLKPNIFHRKNLTNPRSEKKYY